MLSYLFEKTALLISHTVDAVVVVSNTVIDDIADIPNAIERGWNQAEETPSEAPKAEEPKATTSKTQEPENKANTIFDT